MHCPQSSSAVMDSKSPTNAFSWSILLISTQFQQHCFKENLPSLLLFKTTLKCGSNASTYQADPPINQPWAILPSPSAGYMGTHSPHPTPLLSPTIQLKVQARRETLVKLRWATWESRLPAHVPTLCLLVFFGSNSDVLFPTYNGLKEFCGFWKNPY